MSSSSLSSNARFLGLSSGGGEDAGRPGVDIVGKIRIQIFDRLMNGMGGIDVRLKEGSRRMVVAKGSDKENAFTHTLLQRGVIRSVIVGNA